VRILAYEFFDARKTMFSTPDTEWKSDLQALVDDQFSNSPSYYTIQEEVTFGTISWENVNVRVEHIVRSDTGEKLGDDFKSIIFQDFAHARGMGYRYNFDSNIWITVNTDQKKYVTASAILRRCNNVLQKRDVNGNLIQEPCFIDYGYTNDAFNIFRETVLADGEILVCAQNNANTRLFDINERVLFGGQAFKIESKKNFLNNTTYGNNDNPLIVWKMKRVDVSNYDDIVNNIAYDTAQVYTLTINQDNFNQIVGYSSTLSVVVKLNGTIVTEAVTWSSSAPTKVSVNASTGVITCLAVGSATLTCKMSDNPLITDTITITVVAATTPVTETIISPNETYLIQGDPAQVYTVYKYINNVQQADTFTITTSGVATSKYICIVISGNSFSVQNIETDDTALTVLCTNNVDASTKTLLITLGGLY
jgi:uncharacterized protein YjdB